MIRSFATRICFGVIIRPFTFGPWKIAFSSLFVAVVITHTEIFKKPVVWFVFKRCVPFKFSIHVVLWDGSTGCIIVIIASVFWEWPVAQFTISCHTVIFSWIILHFLGALFTVLEDFIIIATIFSIGRRLVFVPAFTALGTLDISALTWSEVWSCFAPLKYANSIIIITIITITITAATTIKVCVKIFRWIIKPLYSTNSSTAWTAGLCAFISECIIARV